MDITIKPLAPELAADYFDFFESRAFTDDSPYRCYCQRYQLTEAQEQAALAGVEPSEMGAVCRRLAEQQIASRALRGYLAYANGVAIGWCNANDRASFPVESGVGTHFYAPPEARERAVVCFEIAPECRGKGVATALLERVVADARADGCLAVEGYPVERAERFEWDCAGPMRLYEKAGFTRAGERGGCVVMRRELQ